MSEDDVFKGKLRISFRKAKHDEVAERNTRTESVFQPAETTSLATSTDSAQHDKVSYSDVSFVLQGEEGPNQYGKLVVTKSRPSRVTKEDEVQQIIPLETRSDDVLKEEIIGSILNDILAKMEDVGLLSKGSSHYFLNQFPSQISKPGVNFMRLADRPPRKTRLSSNREHGNKTLEKNRKRQVASVAKELELPVNLSKSKPNVESRPKFERLVLDTHVATSSTIMTKAQGRSVSATSQPRPSRARSNVLAEDTPTVNSPFELCWCFGFNAEVPVINLSNADSSQVAFANSQYAVIYDFHEDTMSFLQGHLNSVSCITVNPTGSLMVTADSGPDVGTSRVIVWDRRPCVLQVLDNAHPHGCQHVGLSVNGDFLITVSADEIPASIKVWEWEKDNTNPSASTTVKESLGHVKQLTTHPNSRSEFAVTFERSVVFARVAWQTVFHETLNDGRVSEKIKDCEFCVSSSTPPKLGSLTDTTFLEDTEAIALSSTCKGYVIVWEDNMNSRHKKTYRKYVRLHLDCITNITLVDSKIAVATVSGNVSFYDLDLKILFFHKPLNEPLVSISFNLTSQQNNVTTCGEHPSCANTWRREPRKLVDATLKSEPFSVRHFVISTESGKIAYVNASSGTPKFLSFPSKEMFTALDMMPNSEFLCAGTASGKCILFDTDHRKVKVTQKINVQANLCQAVSYLKYSPSGYTLVCGMYTGDIWLLDPFLLSPILESPLTDCNCCITQIVFSSNSEYLIVTDVSYCISVYFLGENPVLIGQYIAHYKSIVTVIICSTEPGDKEIKVFTVSADRSICVFVINREKQSFEFILNQRVEQTAVPTYCVNYPQPYSSAGIYLGVNSDGKLRLHDPPIAAGVTKRCRGTFQAPDFGSPINYLEIFENNNQPYLFFKTKNHIGIHLLPIDGNPFRALGYRASPTEVTCCTINPGGKYVFTISESFGGISMWKINTRAVEDFYKSGGEGLEPFLKVLGEEKEHEIRDFFDLGQFLHQGESPSLVRTLRNSLPICEVANVLQALGCLLTKQEINEMTNEVVNSDLENPSYKIDYDEFVRLYFNYRKTHDLKIEDLRKAFRDFYTGLYFAASCPTDFHVSDTSPIFDSVRFMQKLLVTGEEMSLEELYADFSILTGGHPEPPGDEHLTFQVPPTMPKEISFYTFVKDILGFSIDDSLFREN